jgi:ACS family tartrate transporter-like MFS transporter
MTPDAPSPTEAPSPLDRARVKAYRRLLPILFACYVIAYVDRTNVGLAKLHMMGDLNAQARGDDDARPLFDEEAFGFGAGTCFFVGYLLLEIPGTLLVEKWSARKWICRIMVSWGVIAALTALVKVPWHFYGIRFLLGVAEAGFFPGVIVYLTHWFPSRDRARALSWFLIATPIAQFISPKLTYYLLRIGTDEAIDGAIVRHPLVLGLKGWQWVYIGWGLPAVALGAVVLLFLTDRPRQARWLDDDEREALEAVLAREKAERKAAGGHMTLREAFAHPKVLLLTAAYFFIVTGNYGVEMFLPTILRDWYHPSDRLLTWVLMIPPLGSLFGQLFVGWNSDRTKERRLHAALPILIGAIALGLSLIRGMPLGLMILIFTAAALGTKAYLPAFWTLPSLFLTEAAAAGSIGLINSCGNLGGAVGPWLLGIVKDRTGSFLPGILFLCVSMATSALIILGLGLGRRDARHGLADPDPLADPALGVPGPGATEASVP